MRMNIISCHLYGPKICVPFCCVFADFTMEIPFFVSCENHLNFSLFCERFSCVSGENENFVYFDAISIRCDFKICSKIVMVFQSLWNWVGFCLFVFVHLFHFVRINIIVFFFVAALTLSVHCFRSCVLLFSLYFVSMLLLLLAVDGLSLSPCLKCACICACVCFCFCFQHVRTNVCAHRARYQHSMYISSVYVFVYVAHFSANDFHCISCFQLALQCEVDYASNHLNWMFSFHCFYSISNRIFWCTHTVHWTWLLI